MKKSYFILHIAVVLACFTGIFGKLISLNEVPLVWYRALFSFLWLFFILKLFKVNKNVAFQERFKISRVGLLITIHWIFFYASIKYANISIGVVCYSLTSMFTALFAPIINKQRFVITELLLSMLTLLGIALIFHFDAEYQLGIILGVISSAFAALYTIYNERLVQHYDSKLINYYQMMGATLGLGLLMPAYWYYMPVESILPGVTDTICLLLLSLFCTVILYILFAETLKVIPAFTVNLSFNLEPVYAIVIAFLFFGEAQQVNAAFYAGLFFVAASVGLQSLISIRKSRLASSR